MRNAGIVFDLPLGQGSPVEEARDLFDRNSLLKDAVKRAEELSDNRMITQDVLHEIEEDLPMEDHYAFHMALVDADIRVRTGGRIAQFSSYETEDRYDKFVPHRLSVPEGLLKKVLRQKIGNVAGLDVWEIDAELGRLIDVDLTIGANGARYGYVPLNEIWIADVSKPSDVAPVAMHEAVEFFSMRDRGMTYDEAHERANLFERQLRVKIADGTVKVPDLETAMRVANEWFSTSKTAAVNVVDREEPVVKDLGDAFVNSENLWTGVPSIPRDELNTSPNATTELDYGKPRKSEGEKHEGGGFGNNLTDLTVEGSLSVAAFAVEAQGYGEGTFAVPLEDMLMLLNHAVSLEYSQALRYNVYADTLRVAFRDALAEEFNDHAEEEIEHAKALSAKIVSLGGALSPKITEPVRIPPNDPDLVGRILRELWKEEQEGIKFYRSLKKALGQHVFVHYIEEVLVAESEHVDDLMRFSAMPRSAEIVPLPKSPDRSQPAQWAESYSDENQFEGLDKLGTSELGKCPHCESDEVLGEVCSQCTGKKVSCVRALCEQCDGFGFVKTCIMCGNSWAPPPLLSVGRIATWHRRAGNVRRKTMYGELPVWIEQEVGDIKRGKNREGVAWERKMQAAYGFIPGTRGADGDAIDVYLGNNPTRKVYIVSQMHPGGGFDEEKVMLGYPNAQQAEAMYRAHMPHNGDKHFGGIREMSMGEFEGEYMGSDQANPYKPTLQLRQFQVTGQKMVPNPNPKGREDQVTEEYAEKWKAEHGGGGASPAEGEEDSVFQKFKQDKSKGKKKPAAPAETGPAKSPAKVEEPVEQSVFEKYKQDKP